MYILFVQKRKRGAVGI